MSERPILFSASMVRALLDGRKTQTRRIVKPAGAHEVFPFIGRDDKPTGKFAWCPSASYITKHIFCPYGQPGDWLWVRETFYAFGRWETRFSVTKRRDEWHFIDMTIETGRAYQFDAESIQPCLRARDTGITPAWHKRPSIFMPRIASRIPLEVGAVRVERLQDISEEDAYAEGIKAEDVVCSRCHGRTYHMQGGDSVDCEAPGCGRSAADEYRDLWESLNGGGSWDANPWVWVIEFKDGMDAA